MNGIKKAWDHSLETIRKHPLWTLCILVAMLVVAIPMVRSGIFVNDELLSRERYSYDVGFGFKVRWDISVSQGRILSFLPFAIGNAVIFFTENLWISGIIRALAVFSNIFLCGMFLKRMTGNTRYTRLFVLFALLSMPLTFEHMIPSAYSTPFGLCFSAMMGSLCLFDSYLAAGNRKTLIFSVILYIYAIMGYELFITYSLLFIFPILHNRPFTTWRSWLPTAWKSIRPVFTAGCAYLVSYFIIRIVFVSDYSGNTLTFSDPGRSLQVMWQLLKVAVPGWLFSDEKYHDLLSQAAGESVTPLSTFQNIATNAELLLLGLTIVLFFIWAARQKAQGKKSVMLVTAFSALPFAVFPIILYCFTPMYMSMVSDISCMQGIPGCYFSFIAFCAFLSALGEFVLNKYPKAGYLLAVPVLMLALGTQQCNIWVADAGEAMNDRIVLMERFTTSSFARDNLENQSVCAPTLQKPTYHMIYSTYEGYDSYFTVYGQRRGVDVTFITQPADWYVELGDLGEGWVYASPVEKMEQSLMTSTIFTVYAQKDLADYVMLAKDPETDMYVTGSIVRDKEKDSGLYVFNVTFERSVDVQNARFCRRKKNSIYYGLSDVDTNATDISSAEKIYGWYYFVNSDLWMEQESLTRFYTGENGHMTLAGYLPPDLLNAGVNEITIWFDGKEVYNETTDTGSVNVELQATPRTYIDVKIGMNKVWYNEGYAYGMYVSKFSFD